MINPMAGKRTIQWNGGWKGNGNATSTKATDRKIAMTDMAMVKGPDQQAQ